MGLDGSTCTGYADAAGWHEVLLCTGTLLDAGGLSTTRARRPGRVPVELWRVARPAVARGWVLRGAPGRVSGALSGTHSGTHSVVARFTHVHVPRHTRHVPSLRKKSDSGGVPHPRSAAQTQTLTRRTRTRPPRPPDCLSLPYSASSALVRPDCCSIHMRSRRWPTGCLTRTRRSAAPTGPARTLDCNSAQPSSPTARPPSPS